MASNLVGFANILEGCRDRVSHLIYASSSSVYGANKKVPSAVGDRVDHPVSFYAATKQSNELMAYAYSHLYQLYNLVGHHHPMSLLRFIEIIEQEMGKTAQKNWLPMQPGDVPVTYADIDSLAEVIDFCPTTDPEVGIRQFVHWYQQHYGQMATLAPRQVATQST